MASSAARLLARSDTKLLLRGDVFTTDLLETWISYKRELEPVALRPHPYEFFLYSDI